MKIAQIKKAIEAYKDDRNQAEWEVKNYESQISEKKRKLRELLDCKSGGEKKALRALRDKIENDKKKVEALLESIDEKRGGQN